MERRLDDRDHAVPPGWRENPTSWRRRAALAVLAFAGLVIAGYLTLYQLGAWDTVWDPLFDARTVLDLTAPVPDAAAGVLAYASELVLLAVGGPDRWRSLPWVCPALGFVLACGAVVSIALIVIQPTVGGRVVHPLPRLGRPVARAVRARLRRGSRRLAAHRPRPPSRADAGRCAPGPRALGLTLSGRPAPFRPGRRHRWPSDALVTE